MTSLSVDSSDSPRQGSLAGHVFLCSEPDVRDADGDLTFDHGFMPRTAADQPLTGSHEAWEQLAAQLPELAVSPHVQRVIADLPMLPAGRNDLPDDQLKRGATLLGAMDRSYS